MPVASLTRLVGDADRFVRDTFGRAPLHVAARGDAFDDVLSLDHVDQIVAASGLRAPSFRLVKDGTTLPTRLVTRRARIGSRPVDDLIDVAAVHASFDDGASIVLQGLHRSWAPVAELCRKLEAELTHPVQANAYLTPPVAQGLDLHEDPHDVFAVQTHGVKRWVVHPPDGGPAWDLELRPGEVLYLPAGTRHAAQTIEQPSLHLTIGVRTVSMAQVVRRALEASLDELGLRAPLPAGWADDPPSVATDVAARLDELAMTLRDGAQQTADTAVRAAATEFWSHRTPDRRGGLIDLLELDGLADTTMLRVRPALSLNLERDDDTVTLVLADRRIRFPGPLGAVLEDVTARSRFAPRELDELIDAPSRLVLCRRLIREGVLTFERQDVGGRA